MDLQNRIRNYLFEEEFHFEVYPNYVDVINFTRIGHFDREKVWIDYENGTLLITGHHLVVSKLLKEEVLVVGHIEKIELK